MVRLYTSISKFRFATLAMLLVLIICSSESFGQSIWTNPITGTNPNTANPYTTGQTFTTSITVSGIGRGTGITGTAANDRYNASGWNSGTLDVNDYFSFTLTPNSGCEIDFTSFVYTGQASGTGATSFALRSSVDGFVANIGAPTATGVTINLSAAAYQNITGAITFRLYGWGASAAGGTWSINDFTFNGTVTCGGGCVAPTTTITPLTQTVCANTSASVTVSSSAVTPTYQWQMSANGTTGWANVANGTPTGVTYSGATTATLSAVGTSSAQYYYQCLVTESGTCTATTNTVSLTILAGASVTSQPASVSTSSTGTASYTVTASGTGLSYQWQENSGSGFSDVSNGGTNPTYAGATNSVLTISNPPMSMSGYSYQCIVSNSCGTVTTNGTSTLTVTNALTCPYLVSAVINSCDGCADEGNNEFMVINTGSYSFQVNSTNVKITYSNGPVNLTSGFAAQPTSLATLNTATINACGTTFVDVSSGAATVPANSTLLIINKAACFTGDWSAYCGQGTIYVAFSSASAWSTTGWFGNNTTARNFTTDFSAVNSGCGTTTYGYNQVGIAGTPFDFGSGGDGASVSFNGSSPPTYISGNGNCAPPNTILPITLLDFYGTKNGSVNELVWKVAEEENILSYTIDKSSDAVNFTELGSVSLSQTNKAEPGIKTYEMTDASPYNDITYYRLASTEFNGSTTYHKIISIDDNSKSWSYSHYQQGSELVVVFKNSIPKNSTVDLFDLAGKELVSRKIDQSHMKINVDDIATGIYFVRITTPYKTENFKIIIQK